MKLRYALLLPSPCVSMPVCRERPTGIILHNKIAPAPSETGMESTRFANSTFHHLLSVYENARQDLTCFFIWFLTVILARLVLHASSSWKCKIASIANDLGTAILCRAALPPERKTIHVGKFFCRAGGHFFNIAQQYSYISLKHKQCSVL